ncbi:MAG: hypothetical protein L0338_01945 [Acidobacteria bacterium]|nr:hypothetical protein [Acidobacteriota bacterium]
MDIDAAVSELKQRTLASIPGEMARLVYLASTREYNSGRYLHAGLATMFSEPVAEAALAACHREVFEGLAGAPFEDVLRELEQYCAQSTADTAEFADFWTKVEPYRVLTPGGPCSALAAELLFSNLRISLAILRARPPKSSENPQSA